MRKLTVKNFSVIKEAELEFGKITVLIGPQASGKSLLCKLAYFLEGELPGIAVESLLDRYSWTDFLQAVGREFTERFLTTGWFRTNTEAIFSSQQYSVAIRGMRGPGKPETECSFGNEFKNLYHLIRNNPAKQLPTANRSRNELRQDLFVEISLLRDRKRTRSNTYVPSGRALFAEASKSIAALQNPDMDQITRRFAGLIAWDSRWKAGYLTTGRNAIQEVEYEMYQIAGGTVMVEGGKPYFLSKDGRNLPLFAQSSGTLELLPMFNVIDQLACFQEDIYARTATAKISPIADVSDHSPLIYLEEPEVHIFPKTQYDLVRLFTRLANDPILNFDWVITTHSPYILTAFNNLIEAGQVGRAGPELKDEVAKLIPEQYWIKEGDFKAYAIEDGKLKSILNESGFIESNYLDQVSEVIGNEFDELLRLEYDHTKAS
jgi:energy-coupling factor transporter ATP-binding protein EcfA2